jgi:spore germination cell wall hydrolase CwlJ-like protein
MEKVIRIATFIVGLLIVVFLVQGITLAKMVKLRSDPVASAPDVVSIKTREKQLECMAMNIYREAGYEPFEGKVAVAQVTMNRVKDGRFGDDVCGVIYKKNVVMDKVVCQF